MTSLLLWYIMFVCKMCKECFSNVFAKKSSLDVMPVVVFSTQLSFFSRLPEILCVFGSASHPENSFKFTVLHEFLFNWQEWMERMINAVLTRQIWGFLWAISGVNVQSIHLRKKQAVFMVQKKSCECSWLPQLREKCLQTIVCTAFGNASV